MAMNSDASPMTAVEHRLGVIEKTMVTAEVFEREVGALRGEIGNLRGEMGVEIGALRGEIGTLRGEMRVEIGALRGEIGNLRGEMRVEMGAVRGEIRVGLAKVPFETVKWLLAVSGVAAAIATTVYNLWFR